MMNRVDGSNPPQLSPLPSTDVVIATPCGACKILRRRCTEKCILAPHFPPTEPLKFTMAHRVFGASNIIKLLQEEEQAPDDYYPRKIICLLNDKDEEPLEGEKRPKEEYVARDFWTVDDDVNKNLRRNHDLCEDERNTDSNCSFVSIFNAYIGTTRK